MATLNIIADEIIGALDRPFDYMFKERVKSIFRHEVATMVRQAIDKDGITDHFKTRFLVDISIIDDSSISYAVGNKVLRSTNKIANPVRYKTDTPFTWVGNADASLIYMYTKIYELKYANLTAAYTLQPPRYVYLNDYLYLYDGYTGFEGDISNITYYSSITSGILTVTSTNHNLKDNDSIVITGTTNYDGTYSITWIDDNSFYITKAYVADVTIGSWTKSITGFKVAVEGVYPLGDVFDKEIENRLNSKVFTDDTELPLPEDLIQVIKLKLIGGELSVIDDTDRIKADHIDNN